MCTLKRSYVNKLASEVYNTILFLTLCITANNLRYVSSKSEEFQILSPCTILNDLWPMHKIIHFFLDPYDKTKNLTLFSEEVSMFKFATHMELSRLMAAILEIPQCSETCCFNMLCFHSLSNLRLLTNAPQ